MLMSEWIGLSTMVVTNAGINIGVIKYFQTKIDTIWKRFDEHKENTSNIYVRKDSCMLLHSTTAENLKGLEMRIEKRFDKLEALLNK